MQLVLKIKKTATAKKKNIYVPEVAVDGRFLILSIAPVINNTSKIKPIFSFADEFTVIAIR